MSDFTEAMKQEMYDYFLDWQTYQEEPSVYPQLFDIRNSQAAYEKYNSAIGLGDLLEKPEGEDLLADAPLEGYQVVCKNRTFGRTVRMTFEQVEDNQKFPDFLRTVVGTWKQAIDRTKDRWYVKFFNYGAISAGNDIFNNTITGVVTDSSGALIYDGHAFLDTDHPDKVGGTYANLTVTRALTFDNLATTYLTFTSTNNRDERGNEIIITPDTLLIPPALRFTAQRILDTALIPDSMDNDINVLKSIVTPLEWPRLTDTDGWFLLKKKGGLMALNRMEPEFDFYQDETNKDFYATVILRWGGCVTNWRFTYGCNLAQS